MIKRTKEQRINFWKGLIKSNTSYRGMTLTQLVEKLAEFYGRNPELSNFSSKLRRGTITVLELSEIMDYLDYSIDTIDITTEISKPRKYN